MLVFITLLCVFPSIVGSCQTLYKFDGESEPSPAVGNYYFENPVVEVNMERDSTYGYQKTDTGRHTEGLFLKGTGYNFLDDETQITRVVIYLNVTTGVQLSRYTWHGLSLQNVLRCFGCDETNLDTYQYWQTSEVDLNQGEHGTTHFDVVNNLLYPDITGTYTSIGISSNNGEEANNNWSIFQIDLCEVDYYDPEPSISDASAQVRDNTYIELTWTGEELDFKGGYGEGSMYLVYRDDEEYGLTQKPIFKDYMIEPDVEYTYRVSKLNDYQVESLTGNSVVISAPSTLSPITSQVVDPFTDFNYLGAFQLPEGFMYGCEGMTYVNDSGTASLVIVGAETITDDPYDRLINVAQIEIPETLSSDVSTLTTASFLQNFKNPRPDDFYEYNPYYPDDVVSNWPVFGLAEHKGRIWIQDGDYYYWDKKPTLYSVPVTPSLDGDPKTGPYEIADPVLFQFYQQMLDDVPSNFEDDEDGDMIIMGGFREGKYCGCIPTFILASVSVDDPPGTSIPDAEILSYSGDGMNAYTCDLSANQFYFADTLYDMAWITGGNKESVVVSGLKALGSTWYGYVEYPRMSYYGYFSSNLPYIELPVMEDQGWVTNRYGSYLFFYDPQDFRDVISGSKEEDSLMPYAYLNVGEEFFFNPVVDTARRDGQGAAKGVAYDNLNRRLYVVEDFSKNDIEELITVVHVLEIEGIEPIPDSQEVDDVDDGDDGDDNEDDIQEDLGTSFFQSMSLLPLFL